MEVREQRREVVAVRGGEERVDTLADARGAPGTSGEAGAPNIPGVTAPSAGGTGTPPVARPSGPGPKVQPVPARPVPGAAGGQGEQPDRTSAQPARAPRPVPARVPRTSGRVPVNGSVNHLLLRTGAGAPLPGQAALGLLGLLSAARRVAVSSPEGDPAPSGRVGSSDVFEGRG